MLKFDIFEDGVRFATVEARTAVAALRKAADAYPRRAADYNMEPGDKGFMVDWYAREVNGSGSAKASVTVPGRSAHGCRFYDRTSRKGGGGANLVGDMGYYAAGGMTSAARLARMVGPGPGDGGGGAKAALDVVLHAFLKAHPFHKTHRVNAWIGRGPEAKRHVGCRSCDRSWVRKGNSFVEASERGYGGGANGRRSDGEREGAVDETIDTLIAALDAFGFTQTGSAKVDDGSLYGKRAENAPRRYIGRVHDRTGTRYAINEWFERNGPHLPE